MDNVFGIPWKKNEQVSLSAPDDHEPGYIKPKKFLDEAEITYYKDLIHKLTCDAHDQENIGNVRDALDYYSRAIRIGAKIADAGHPIESNVDEQLVYDYSLLLLKSLSPHDHIFGIACLRFLSEIKNHIDATVQLVGHFSTRKENEFAAYYFHRAQALQRERNELLIGPELLSSCQ